MSLPFIPPPKRARDVLIDPAKLSPAEDLVRRIHRVLYPERYLSPEAIAELGIPTDEGYHQWSADTPEQIAELIDAYVEPGIVQSDPTPRP